MGLLGTLSGRGVLLSKGQPDCEVDYRLDIFTRGAIRDGSGQLQAISGDLFSHYSADSNTLRLKDGRSVDIVIDRMDVAGASFKTTGPVPAV